MDYALPTQMVTLPSTNLAAHGHESNSQPAMP